MDDGESVVEGEMGMGICRSDLAMSGPPGVGDADAPPHGRQVFLEIHLLHAPGVFPHLDAVIADHAQTAGIVTPVFQIPD